MTAFAYYNEFDPYAAQWLRNLIHAGHIAPGFVDDRSITDVKPEDLEGFTQCHFFAGIGVWSLALRGAGWADDQAVWTGSCPCQPFSAAGNQLGTADVRHLAPVWLRLIKERRPASLFGEQVAAAIGKHWLDDLFTELENQGYACGAAVLPACGVGAPHIRQRLWFGASRLADSDLLERPLTLPKRCNQRVQGERQQGTSAVTGCGGAGGLVYTDDQRLQRVGADNYPVRREEQNVRPSGLCDGTGSISAAGKTKGFWRNAEWLSCKDGKFRPVEPGTFPLVNGSASRVGRLRAYGNAVNAQAAQAFLTAFMEARP